MDVKEKLVELLQNAKSAMKSENLSCDIARNMFVVDFMMSNGVTVQEWISVEDGLPQYTDEYNVTVGVPSEFGYFEKVKTLRFERIKGKEPRWVIPKNEIYNVIAWMELPKKYQPPKGE